MEPQYQPAEFSPRRINFAQHKVLQRVKEDGQIGAFGGGHSDHSLFHGPPFSHLGCGRYG